MEKIVNKVPVGEKNDYKYWRKQPFVKRLQALEEIRSEYNSLKYGSERGFQRAYTIVKRT